ncbi:MAG: hypothetical protein LBO09_01360 [Candidatus Peribacteria bacterium]|nr:hypothetical protein [Candidatus Peribacteria bacterium]
MAQADFKTIRKFQKIQERLVDLEAEQKRLLRNKEIVAAHEHHKLAIYAQALQAGKLVQTPSVQATKRHLREQILSGKTLLLS